MTTTLIDAESVLAIDLGSTHTRALLFDVVDGQYHFLAAGNAPSTSGTPYRDVGQGFQQALINLEQITGRVLFSAEGHLLLPSTPEGSGIDRLVVTYSDGPELRIVIAGLLEDVSLESAARLAATTGGRVVESIGLNDRRMINDQIDAIIKADPHLVILAGGTEGGATRSVYKVADMIGLACRLLPQEKRPELIYAGNQELGAKIKDGLGRIMTVQVSANIRPEIDQENLNPAQEAVYQSVMRVRAKQLTGLTELATLSATPPMLSPRAFGRMIRYLSQIYDPNKGVLGVDLGAETTSIAAAQGGKLWLFSAPFGMGSRREVLLQQTELSEVKQWLPMHITDETLRDELWQHTLFPRALPLDDEGVAIEQAVARVALQKVKKQASRGWPDTAALFEPIIASGMTLGSASNTGAALLILLDSLQPVGVTTLVLDQNQLLPALGAIAGFDSVLPIQVLESGALLNLGTVVSPLSDERYGTPILEVKLEYEQGGSDQFEIRSGTIAALPLGQGQTARLNLNFLHRTRLDPSSKRHETSFKVTGGVCGVVIDARGRPLSLPSDDSRRRDLLKKWLLAVGG